jgi:2-(1,2-epoxy-1,2-dihydrophenyl)acetyl-CoA isomerase
MSDASEALICTVAGGIARMTFNRPEARNAMTGSMIRDMIDFCRRIEGDADVRCLSISGRGEHFMAGGDVKGFTAAIDQPAERLRADFEQRSRDAEPLWVILERMPQPVVCSVRGYCAGAGLSFVAGADLALAADGAQFLLAHVGLGLCPDAATTYHLPRTVGVKTAKQLAFFGDRFDAGEALRMGLVNWVVPDAELDAKTEEVLERLVRAPSVSLAQSKRLMNRALGSTLAEQLAEEGLGVGACAASEDLKEGVRAFVEKRKPRFQGR